MLSFCFYFIIAAPSSTTAAAAPGALAQTMLNPSQIALAAARNLGMPSALPAQAAGGLGASAGYQANPQLLAQVMRTAQQQQAAQGQCERLLARAHGVCGEGGARKGPTCVGCTSYLFGEKSGWSSKSPKVVVCVGLLVFRFTVSRADWWWLLPPVTSVESVPFWTSFLRMWTRPCFCVEQESLLPLVARVSWIQAPLLSCVVINRVRATFCPPAFHEA